MTVNILEGEQSPKELLSFSQGVYCLIQCLHQCAITYHMRNSFHFPYNFQHQFQSTYIIWEDDTKSDTLRELNDSAELTLRGEAVLAEGVVNLLLAAADIRTEGEEERMSWCECTRVSSYVFADLLLYIRSVWEWTPRKEVRRRVGSMDLKTCIKCKIWYIWVRPDKTPESLIAIIYYLMQLK